MTEHDRVREMLARRAELSQAEESQLRLHLEGCPECRETAAAYATQTALLRSLPAATPPPALRAAVLAGARTQRPVPFWRRPLVAVAPVSAVLALAIVALVLLSRPHVPTHHTSIAGHPTATPTSLVPNAVTAPKPMATPVRRSGGRGRSTQPRAVPTAPPVSGGTSGQVALGPAQSGSAPQSGGSQGVPTVASGPLAGVAALPEPTRSTPSRSPSPVSSGCCAGNPTVSPAAPTRPPAAQPTVAPQPTAAPTVSKAAPVAPARQPPTGTPVAPAVPLIPTPGGGSVSTDAERGTPTPAPTPAYGAVNVAAPVSTPVPPPAPVQP